MDKLDPRIASLLGGEVPRPRQLSSTEEEELLVYIQYQDGHQPIEEVGIKIQYYDGEILTGRATLEQIKQIALLPNVIYIEKAGNIKLALDKSITDIKANEVRSVNTGNHSWTGLTGNGVVVGIIDVGVDYRHKSFQTNDKKTRIKFIWDKTLDKEGSEKSPAAFKFNNPSTGQEFKVDHPSGVEYTEKQINDALATDNPLSLVRHEDGNKKEGSIAKRHGTHVAGIAAGNGLQDDRCTDTYTYSGVAPEAEIIVVKVETALDITEGLTYILSKAGTKPVVINLSMGINQGPHDGSSSFTRSLDRQVEGLSGKILVTSSGNEADANWHTKKTIETSKEVEVEINFQAEDDDEHSLDIWYPNGKSLDVSLKPPGIAFQGPVKAGDGEKKFTLSSGHEISITSIKGAAGRDNQIYISVDPKKKFNISGAWKLKVKNSGADEVTFHGWLDGSGSSPYFNDADADKSMTLSEPADGKHLISVGSYATRGLFSEGKLSSFSSRGPTRDSRNKPEIAAPGEGIVSARGTQPGCCDKFWCWCCNIYHNSKDGTSMAAPHVAGAIALMLEKNKDLTLTDAINHLSNSATKDDNTTNTPNPNIWGAGKLNVKGATDLVPNAVSPRDSAPGNRNLPPTGTEDDTPSSSPPADSSINEGAFISTDTLNQLFSRLLESSLGQKFARLSEEHADEIWRLINTNKRVAVAWHRHGGKPVMRVVMNALAFPDRSIPVVIEEVSTKERLERIASIFLEYGSKKLQQDISNHLDLLYPLIGLSINEGLEKLVDLSAEAKQLVPTIS